MGHLYLVQLLEDGVAEGLARDAGQEGGLTGCAQPRTPWGRDPQVGPADMEAQACALPRCHWDASEGPQLSQMRLLTSSAGAEA